MNNKNLEKIKYKNDTMTEMTVKEFQFDYKIGRIYREKEIVYLGKSLQVYTFFFG